MRGKNGGQQRVLWKTVSIMYLSRSIARDPGTLHVDLDALMSFRFVVGPYI